MELKQLFVTRSGYNSKSPLGGSVEFGNEIGKITLNLDDEMARQILAICADAIVRVSQKAATEMSVKVIDAIAAQEKPYDAG